jgi:hypothetical protein
MSVSQSGVKAHDDTCNKAEALRQAAAVAGASQASVKIAEVAYYRTCLASARANGVSPSQFISALYELGQAGA